MPHNRLAAITLDEPPESGGERRLLRRGGRRGPGDAERVVLQEHAFVEGRIEAREVADGGDEAGRRVDPLW